MARRYHSSKRRAIMRQGDPIVHFEVFERDEWMCHICKQQIDRRLRGEGVWMRATIDHIIPLSRGGPHTYENVAAAHWICNQRKGDQLTLDSLEDII